METVFAEGKGFEPSNRLSPITRFPGVRLRPLGHPSVLVSETLSNLVLCFLTDALLQASVGVLSHQLGQFSRSPVKKTVIFGDELVFVTSLRIPFHSHAEGVGFEPTRRFRPNGLANRPLNHLSNPPVAEDLGFEPRNQFPDYLFSRQAPSTARPTFRLRRVRESNPHESCSPNWFQTSGHRLLA